MPEDPDARLKALIESGSKEDLARELVAPVLGVLLRRNPDEDGAAAALGTAVKALVSARRRYKPGTSIRSWILSIVTAKLPGEKPRAPSINKLPAGETAAELAKTDEIVDDVEALLSALAEDLREAIELLAVEGLAPSEAATVLKIPSAIVEHRAEKALDEMAGMILSMTK
jgi:DNA-directed RNA polymerase specialized sigma24 family protein